MIRLENINKYYQSGNDKIHVLKNLNYVFPDTGLAFILGPSGSGKSTLLNLLGGLDTPDTGEIYIEDRPLSSFSNAERNNYLNSYLGFVFQEYNILKDLNLRENISLALEIQGYKKKSINKKITQIIHDVELNGLEKRKVNQLSGGQKQRIAIARALVKEPKLIIADEPTTALDVTIQAQILDLLREIQMKLGTATILVSHDLGVVARVADRVAVMYAGKIVEIGTAEEVYYDPRHPYTWGLMRSLPAFANGKESLYTIPGMPPTLIDPPKGDAFACRNEYALNIDYEEMPPMFKITDTHYAATWLLDPRAPQIKSPVGGTAHE